uniref:Strictosidine synthase conserved region domain-containing protein n=1 Tax=Panagrolaimus sp. ES5 TaxID=591445 RepID=A0AC34FC37_9BILA
MSQVNVHTFMELKMERGTDLNNATNSSGAIYAWKLEGREIVKAELIGFKSSALFNPYGISTFMNILMVTNPLNVNNSFDRVDIFHILPSKTRATFPKIKFIKSVSSDVMTGIRGIAAVGKEQFYVANTFKFRGKLARDAEWLLGMNTGAILYFNGKKVEIALKGISTPTGLAYDRHKRQLFVGSYSAQKIYVYRANFANLTKVNEINLQVSPYFISLDPITANLLVAVQPLKFRNFIYETRPWNYFTPSLILQIKKLKSKWSITQLYANDGATISAATTAITIFLPEKPPQLLIGNLRTGILSCDLTSV